MNFKLRPLSGFLLAAHHQSFKLAAERLAMTQPAFSQMIRELENVLGVQLFERSTRSVALTEAGHQLRSLVERPLEDLDEAWRHMREVAAGQRGRIVFAALPSVAFGIGTATLARFKAARPGITARLIEEAGTPLVARVLSREVDFGIGVLEHGHPELEFRELLRDDLVAVVPSGHRLARADAPQASWQELAGEELVLMQRESNIRWLAEHSFLAAGIDIKAAYEVANMVTALGMVRAGLGITFMPRMVLPEMNMEGLVAVELHEPAAVRVIGVITRVNRALSPATRAFLELLFDQAASRPA
jgi:LysR family transcriptional regulator, carnitine catabolism transcriptional activator